jgi:hypothetical protein
MKQGVTSDKFDEVMIVRDVNLFDDNKHLVNQTTDDSRVLIVRIEESLYFANIQR